MSESPPIPPPSRASWFLVAFAAIVLGGLAFAYWWVGQSASTADETDEPDETDDANEKDETMDAPPRLGDQ